MPNIKSAIKRDSISKARNISNKSRRSTLRTMIKRFDTAAADGNLGAAKEAYVSAIKTIDHAAVKGLIHKNNAARKKSRLTLKLNSMSHQ